MKRRQHLLLAALDDVPRTLNCLEVKLGLRPRSGPNDLRRQEEARRNDTIRGDLRFLLRQGFAFTWRERLDDLNNAESVIVSFWSHLEDPVMYKWAGSRRSAADALRFVKGPRRPGERFPAPGVYRYDDPTALRFLERRAIYGAKARKVLFFLEAYEKATAGKP